ncbi:MAG TPA: AI-2E family transporter [Acidimicrobiales bacterium]|nr:AI-2E family transporter [Acidimicrobiales bacterium]
MAAEASGPAEPEEREQPETPIAPPLPESVERSRARVTLELDWMSLIIVGGALLAVLVVVGLVSSGADALLRIGAGIVLALALDPVVGIVRRRLHCRRTVAVVFVGLGLLLAFTILLVVMGPAAVRQAQKFGDELPKTVQGMYDLPIIGPRLERADAANRVQQWAEELPAHIDTDTITNLTSALVSGAATLFTAIVVAFAVLLDGEFLVARVRRLVPARHRPQADWIGRTFYKVLAKYFAGSLLVAVLAGVYILAVGLILQVPLAPLAAVWMMVTDLIPQVGGFLGGFVFVTLGLSASPLTGVICLVLYLLYMNFENHILQPAIIGDAVNLSPPTTMLAALIGGAALGVPGAIIGTPIAGTAKGLYMEFRYGRINQEGSDA